MSADDLRFGDPSFNDEVVPCPTCWLPADLVAPTKVDVLYHSRCPRGHDNTLVPAVLSHLRTLMAREVDRSA